MRHFDVGPRRIRAQIVHVSVRVFDADELHHFPASVRDLPDDPSVGDPVRQVDPTFVGGLYRDDGHQRARVAERTVVDRAAVQLLLDLVEPLERQIGVSVRKARNAVGVDPPAAAARKSVFVIQRQRDAQFGGLPGGMPVQFEIVAAQVFGGEPGPERQDRETSVAAPAYEAGHLFVDALARDARIVPEPERLGPVVGGGVSELLSVLRGER